MKTNFSEIELINGPDYVVNKTPFVDNLSSKFDVVVQYTDQFKDKIDLLNEDFTDDEISYALYEESTEKGGGGDFVSHILYDPALHSVAKFLVETTAQWLLSKVADNVFAKVKKLLSVTHSNSEQAQGIYFIVKVGQSEHWFYFSTAYSPDAVDSAIEKIKEMVSTRTLDLNAQQSTYFFDYSSKSWIRVGY